MKTRFLVCGWLILALLAGCTRAPLKDRAKAMRLGGAPELSDDGSLADLETGLRAQAAQLKMVAKDSPTLVFGERIVGKADYALALEFLADRIQKEPSLETLRGEVLSRFDFYEPYGDKNWAEVFMTSYFEPEIQGSKVKTYRFSDPIFARPKDLVEVPLSRFDDRFADVGTMRGRLGPRKDRLELLPYFSRREIADGALSGKKLELAWADPVDLFFMQIQGAGVVSFPDGTRLPLNYSDQNGHKYEAIGKFLLEHIPRENLSLATIESFIRGLSPSQAKDLLFKNPSYVFYEPREGAAKTSFGTDVIEGRTIATDTRFFPKGTLAFLSFESPATVPQGLEAPAEWRKTSRFVFDQDVGGAIRGGGRVDLFWGTGDTAKQNAGWIKQSAKLRYLVPKDAWLAELRVAAELGK